QFIFFFFLSFVLLFVPRTIFFPVTIRLCVGGWGPATIYGVIRSRHKFSNHAGQPQRSGAVEAILHFVEQAPRLVDFSCAAATIPRTFAAAAGLALGFLEIPEKKFAGRAAASRGHLFLGQDHWENH
ncbi:MAG: hypothetical protein LBG47_04685, partial [Prevotellaceae bacterium]|nr:hypothetical protein [Prevotellaceae bacterium]